MNFIFWGEISCAVIGGGIVVYAFTHIKWDLSRRVIYTKAFLKRKRFLNLDHLDKIGPPVQQIYVDNNLNAKDVTPLSVKNELVNKKIVHIPLIDSIDIYKGKNIASLPIITVSATEGMSVFTILQARGLLYKDNLVQFIKHQKIKLDDSVLELDRVLNEEGKHIIYLEDKPALIIRVVSSTKG